MAHLLLKSIAALWLAAWGLAAHAALTIEITQGVERGMPVAIVPFAWEGPAAPQQEVGAIVQADLVRSGRFDAIPESDFLSRPSEDSQVVFKDWRLIKAEALVIGKVRDLGADRYAVQFQLYDVFRGTQLAGYRYTVEGRHLRRVAHQISDIVYEKLTGEPGAFDTRIAYVTVERGTRDRYLLQIADSDGYNPQTVVRSREPLLSPAWSPAGRRLAYVSFERGNSTIYIQEIATGAREVVASFRGINGAPNFSPDGSRLALTLSKGGNPDIYVMDLGSRQLRQVTTHWGIDTEAVWTPDGQSLVFTSDRGGKPQLYQVAAAGGDAVRVSFQGDYNAKASVSFDGKKIAMAQGGGNIYRIAVLDRSSGGNGVWQLLSPGNLDESPSFAPNASMLLYATKEGSRGVLYAVSVDGRVRQRLVLADGDVREPAWSPFRQR